MAATRMAYPLCQVRTCLPIVSFWLLIGRASLRAPALSWMMRAPKAPADAIKPLIYYWVLTMCPGAAAQMVRSYHSMFDGGSTTRGSHCQ